MSETNKNNYPLKSCLSVINSTFYFNDSVKIQPQGKRFLVTIQNLAYMIKPVIEIS